MRPKYLNLIHKQKCSTLVWSPVKYAEQLLDWATSLLEHSLRLTLNRIQFKFIIPSISLFHSFIYDNSQPHWKLNRRWFQYNVKKVSKVKLTVLERNMHDPESRFRFKKKIMTAANCECGNPIIWSLKDWLFSKYHRSFFSFLPTIFVVTHYLWR